MRTQSQDTSEWIERVMILGHRQFSSIQRFQRICSLTGSIFAMRSTDQFSCADAFHQYYGMTWTGNDGAREAPPFDIQSSLRTIANLADELGQVVVLTGSIACCLYGFPRTVHDIDFLTMPLAMELISQHLPPNWIPLSSPENQRSFVDSTTLVKVDLMTTQGQIPLDPLFIHRQHMLISDEGTSLDILSPEDVILTRLAWYQDQGTSPDDQWNDLMGIIKIHAPLLDWSYLRSQAQGFPLISIFNQLLNDCDEGDFAYVESHEYSSHHSDLESRA